MVKDARVEVCYPIATSRILASNPYNKFLDASLLDIHSVCAGIMGTFRAGCDRTGIGSSGGKESLIPPG